MEHYYFARNGVSMFPNSSHQTATLCILHRTISRLLENAIVCTTRNTNNFSSNCWSSVKPFGQEKFEKKKKKGKEKNISEEVAKTRNQGTRGLSTAKPSFYEGVWIFCNSIGRLSMKTRRQVNHAGLHPRTNFLRGGGTEADDDVP